MPEPLLLRASEAAEMLAVSNATFWRKYSAGQIPRAVRIGSAPRWKLDELRRWIDAGCPPQSEWDAARELRIAQ